MSNKTLPRPLAGVLVAAALVAAACGSETNTVGLDASAADQAASEESTTSQASSDSTDAPEPESAASDESEGPQVDEEEAAPADVGNHLFPDLETVNIADGATLNLATELAGGDTPVLLWFFAPH